MKRSISWENSGIISDQCWSYGRKYVSAKKTGLERARLTRFSRASEIVAATRLQLGIVEALLRVHATRDGDGGEESRDSQPGVAVRDDVHGLERDQVGEEGGNGSPEGNASAGGNDTIT